MLEGENIWILGGVLSFCAVSINFDSIFLNDFCQEGIESSAFSNLTIFCFSILISLLIYHASVLTSLDFKIDKIIPCVFGETCIQKSLSGVLPSTPLAPIMFDDFVTLTSYKTFSGQYLVW